MDCSPPDSSVCGKSQQEYWSGLSFSSPGYLPNLGIESDFPTLKANSLPLELPGKFMDTDRVPLSLFLSSTPINLMIMELYHTLEAVLFVTNFLFFLEL